MRNPYYDLLDMGTHVLVANTERGFPRGYTPDERLYQGEQSGIVVEFVESSSPRYRGYKVQLSDGSVSQYGVGYVRLPGEKYAHDSSHQ